MAAVLKTAMGWKPHRGFESHALRHVVYSKTVALRSLSDNVGRRCGPFSLNYSPPFADATRLVPSDPKARFISLWITSENESSETASIAGSSVAKRRWPEPASPTCCPDPARSFSGRCLSVDDDPSGSSIQSGNLSSESAKKWYHADFISGTIWTVSTNLRLSREAAAALKEASAKSGRSQQELIREAVDRYLGRTNELDDLQAAINSGLVNPPSSFQDCAPSIYLKDGRTTADLLDRDGDR
jgi:predicted DNA-binding protein